MKMNHVLLQVSDMERSRAFYEELMGLRLQHDFGKHMSFTHGLSIHERGDYDKLIGSRIPTDHKAILYFESDDLEADLKAVIEAGTTLIHKIETQPWNQRLFRCLDPDGNLVEVGESVRELVLRLHREGMDREKILETTQLPHDMVDYALDDAYGDRQSRKS
jgi:catechol 2,3-dioxygenase-like lactoylglutathione lyase family enzyme